MPLTPFQWKVAHLLAKNRSPESHIAGGAVLNREEGSVRFSDDLDIFHDVAASVAASASQDMLALRAQGLSVVCTYQGQGLVRAVASDTVNQLRLDWTSDSAFRFFPIQKDDDFGFVLHPADLATNKILALAGRSEIRDFLDILQIDSSFLSLGAMVWAACGKDQGYTPASLLDETNRHARYQESDLKSEHLARPVDLRALKTQWLSSRQRAEELFERLPAAELGCLYLDSKGQPITPDPDGPEFAKLRRHFGSIRGAWPAIS
jgi:hypothetical protein